ncbi:hypothetical protein K439DRAFT_1326159, partial [Ramaria rubella]
KLTGYRLLILVLTTSFGTLKAILSLKGQSIVPNSLDLAFGVLVTLALWWLGLYESIDPPIFTWFFHVDYSHRIFRILRLLMKLSVRCSWICESIQKNITRQPL